MNFNNNKNIVQLQQYLSRENYQVVYMKLKYHIFVKLNNSNELDYLSIIQNIKKELQNELK